MVGFLTVDHIPINILSSLQRHPLFTWNVKNYDKVKALYQLLRDEFAIHHLGVNIGPTVNVTAGKLTSHLFLTFTTVVNDDCGSQRSQTSWILIGGFFGK